jgi:hypothetical protein
MNLLEFLIRVACSVFDQAGEFFSQLSGLWGVFGGGGALTGIAVADFINLDPADKPTEGTLALTRGWHGSRRQKLMNIKNLLAILAAHKNWAYSAEVVARLTVLGGRIEVLTEKCESNQASGADREELKQLLKQAIALCTRQMKFWALNMYALGEMTLPDLHSLGFLLPGERGVSRARARATLALGVPRPVVIDADHVRVTVDHAFGENAGQVASGWPPDAKFILIVIRASDGKTEVFRTISSQIHNDIQMPEGSHGKIFLVRAAFLRHPDDEPHFGLEPTFSMPFTTGDLASGEA